MTLGHIEPVHPGEELLADGAFSIADMIAFTGLSRATIYREIEAGRLVYLKQGRRTLIPRKAAIQLLANGLRGGASNSGA
ncbi:MAG TPA: helix-turn-helix domain-containing protein [Burkholderiales bacterium]|nr:helix-turn-helix domain-containing protein [Burkholderiales bacterium]